MGVDSRMNQENMNRIADLEDMLISMWGKEDYSDVRWDYQRELEDILDNCDHKFPNGTSAWSNGPEIASCEICTAERSRS
jgi:hypothetical protein